MRFNELTEAIDPNELLNRFVNKWVTTTPYERNTLSYSIVGSLLKSFPEAAFEGPAYRSVSIDAQVLERFTNQVYVHRDKLESDHLEARRDSQSEDPLVRAEAHSVLQYWDQIKHFETLKPNGSRIWWNLLQTHIGQQNSGRYVSWSASRSGIEKFNRIVNKANRDIPVQFEGAPLPSSFTVASHVKGLALFKLVDRIDDPHRISELLDTQEVVAPMGQFKIIERSNPDYQLSKITYELTDYD